MHRNAAWIAFLLIVVTISLWFVVKAGSDLLHYARMNMQTPATIEKWTIEELKNGEYRINAIFSFTFKNKNYQEKGQVGGRYPNPWAAEQALARFSKKNWMAWVDPKSPSKALLEKKFPYKTALSASVLLGLTIYFFCLGFYVGKENDHNL
ncbi:MAG: hypothetical protein WAM28_03650 [Chlamydiales bacterium]